MKLVFDIGCDTGKWLSANFNRETIFICVEPNKIAYKEVVKKFKHEPTVIILNMLLADKVGVYDFYPFSSISTCSNDWMTKSRHASVATWGSPVKIKASTLDELIKEYGIPDYIKIDVEGFELKVLKGLTQKVGMIAFEFVEEIPDIVYGCMEYLNKLGYKEWNWCYGDGYTHIPKEWVSYDSLVDMFKNMFVDGRNQCWGMIYCK